MEGETLRQGASAVCDDWELSMGANLLSVPDTDVLMKRLRSALEDGGEPGDEVMETIDLDQALNTEQLRAMIARQTREK